MLPKSSPYLLFGSGTAIRVGFAASLAEAAAFAAAGADFVLVGDFIWADPRGAKAALIEIDQAIKEAHSAAFGKARAG